LVRGIGIAALFIPSTATLVALTLLPAILSTVGPRLDWPRRRSSVQVSRFWAAWSRRVTGHRVAAGVRGPGYPGRLAGGAPAGQRGRNRPGRQLTCRHQEHRPPRCARRW